MHRSPRYNVCVVDVLKSIRYNSFISKGLIAHLVERLFCTQEVRSSSLLESTKFNRPDGFFGVFVWATSSDG